MQAFSPGSPNIFPWVSVTIIDSGTLEAEGEFCNVLRKCGLLL